MAKSVKGGPHLLTPGGAHTFPLDTSPDRSRILLVEGGSYSLRDDDSLLTSVGATG